MKMMHCQSLRSQRSVTRCYLRFANLTERSVNVVWVNFSGQFVSYKILNRGQYLDVNTFKSHPWIAFDTNTKDRMHLNKSFVYDPQTFREYYADRFPQCKLRHGVESRIIVGITLPVHTLKHTALLYLKNCLNDPNHVNLLDLPKFLSDALKALIQEKNNLNTLPLFGVSTQSLLLSPGNNNQT